jgi:uncharacterized protein YcfL
MIRHFYFSILAVLLLAGCSSNSQQEQLDLLASNRAQLLNAQLPVEQGPLSILRAIAQKNVIEIMMIYNTDAPDVPSTDQLVKSSITQYCADKSTLANLNAGVVYRIKLRNTRGQLMVDRMVSKDDCASKK